MVALNKSNNTTFLFSTHDPSVIKFAKKIIILKDGIINSEKSPSEAIERFTHK
jgi:putative ABC transport system ATP-binding protein